MVGNFGQLALKAPPSPQPLQSVSKAKYPFSKHINTQQGLQSITRRETELNVSKNITL